MDGAGGVGGAGGAGGAAATAMRRSTIEQAKRSPVLSSGLTGQRVGAVTTQAFLLVRSQSVGIHASPAQIVAAAYTTSTRKKSGVVIAWVKS